MRRFVDSDDHDDPMLSVVNVIDVFLVIVVMLLIVVARSSANVLETDGRTVPQDFTELERFETSGELGEGSGVKAGTTYRLDDGTLIFVPDQ